MRRVRALLITLTLSACVARDEPAFSPRLSEPPFTYDVRREGASLILDLRSGDLPGHIDVSVTSGAAEAIAERLGARSQTRRYTIDPDAAWVVSVRWAAPSGVAGATSVRHVPNVQSAAPRFEAITPTTHGVLPIDAAVRLEPR